MKKIVLSAAVILVSGCGSGNQAVVPATINNVTHYVDSTCNNYYTDTIINRITYINDTVHDNTLRIIHDNHFSTTTQHDTVTVVKTVVQPQTVKVVDKTWRRRFWITICGIIGVLGIIAWKAVS